MFALQDMEIIGERVGQARRAHQTVDPDDLAKLLKATTTIGLAAVTNQLPSHHLSNAKRLLELVREDAQRLVQAIPAH